MRERLFHIGPPETEKSVRDVPINDKCRKALEKLDNEMDASRFEEEDQQAPYNIEEIC